jgi:TetR/AcrR family transcriptional repressor of nem operon
MKKAKIKAVRQPEETRKKIVDAAMSLILQQGFAATGVEQICQTAGLTKGAFFHHFASKEEAGQAALAAWAAHGSALYAAAEAIPLLHPLDHLHRFFDIMIGFVRDTPGHVTCVVGIISQEVALSTPALQGPASTYLTDWTTFATHLLTQAKIALPPRVDFDPAEVAWFLNGLWQGSMLIAKTTQNPDLIIRNLERARAYVDDLFGLTLPKAA